MKRECKISPTIQQRGTDKSLETSTTFTNPKAAQPSVTAAAETTVTSAPRRRPSSHLFQPELCNFRAAPTLGKQLQVQDIFNFSKGAQYF